MNIKKTLLIVFTICCIMIIGALISDNAQAATTTASGTCGDNLTWTLDSDGVLTISGSGDMSNYQWTSSEASPWYYLRNSIRKVIIKKGVTSLGDYAFYNCSSLSSIEIPEGVTSIGRNALCSCNSLTGIKIPKSVISIGDFVFSSSSSLTSIVVDSNNAVYDSRNNCNAIIETSSNTLIAGCKNTIIPNSVTSIRYGAFYGCSNLTNIEIPDSVTSIGNYAFEMCSNLTSIKLPNSLTSIGEFTFSSCKSLTSIEIPNSVTSICNYAFSDCSSLTSIDIPNSITSIGYDAFYGCTLTAYYTDGLQVSRNNYGGTLSWVKHEHSYDNSCDATCNICGYTRSITHEWQEIILEDNSNLKSEATFESNAIYYKVCSVCNEISTETFEARNTKITFISGTCGANVEWTLDSDGVLTISGSGEMYDYLDNTQPWYDYIDEIKHIILGNGLTSIGGDAFYACKSLTSVEISNSVTSIGASAFRACTSLTSIKIPNSVTSIGKGTFNCCSGLISIEIPNSVTSIGDWAFSGCTSLINISIPNNLSNIRSNVFYYCSSLTSIVIPDGVTSIGDSAFLRCKSLKSIEVPASLTNIEYNAFFGCNLTIYYDKDFQASREQYGGTINWVLKEASSISVTTIPSIVYDRSTDTISVSDGKINACYNSGSSKEIDLTSDMITKIDKTIDTQQEIEVSYDGKLATFLASILIEGEAKPALYGDLNEDGKVDSRDAIYLLMHTQFPDTYPLPIGADYDLNNDGNINSRDAIYLLMYTHFSTDYPLDPKKYAA